MLLKELVGSLSSGMTKANCCNSAYRLKMLIMHYLALGENDW